MSAVCGAVLAGNASAEDCSKVLFEKTVHTTLDTVSELSLAWSMSEDTYEEMKRQFGLDTVVYGVPLKAEYGDYRAAVQRKAAALKLKNFDARSYAYATSSLDSNSVVAYRDCLASKERGLHVFQTKSTEYFIVKVIYELEKEVSPNQRGYATTRNIDDVSSRQLEKAIKRTKFNTVDHEYALKPIAPQQESVVRIQVGNAASAVLVLPPLDNPENEFTCSKIMGTLGEPSESGGLLKGVENNNLEPTDPVRGHVEKFDCGPSGTLVHVEVAGYVHVQGQECVGTQPGDAAFTLSAPPGTVQDRITPANNPDERVWASFNVRTPVEFALKCTHPGCNSSKTALPCTGGIEILATGISK